MEYRTRPFRPDDTEQVVALWESCGLVRPWNDPRRDIERKRTVQPELFLVVERADTEPTDAGRPAISPPATSPADAGRVDPSPATTAPSGSSVSAIVAAGMAGFDGHRGWVNYLAVQPDLQGSGLGRGLMAEFERLLTDMGCPKVNLQVRAGNEQVIRFYESLGYAPDHAVSLGKRLIPDD